MSHPAPPAPATGPAPHAHTLPPEPEEERRTTWLELFFDLVLVFAVTQLAAMLHDVPHHHHGHELAGWMEVGLLAALTGRKR